jgi:hypothetical protein
VNASRRIVLEIISVLAGAVIGTLVAGFLAWLFAGEPFVAAMFSPRDYALALVVVTVFAVLYARLSATPAVLASLAVGTFLPVIVDRFAFGWNPGWLALVLVNLAFAVVALSAYRFVHANALAREAAGRATPR